MNRRLYRSPDDRVWAGVAGGMAETYDLDPSLVRVGWALLALLTGGAFLILYVIMALVVPLRPAGMTLWAAAPTGAPGEPGLATDAAPSGGAPLGAYAPGYGPTAPHRRNRSGTAGPIVFGFILILVGGYFLVRQFIPALDLGLIWPIAVIGGGVVLLLAAFARQRPGQ